MLKDGQAVEAIKALEQVPESLEDTVHLKYLLGLAHYRCGNHGKAVAHLRESLLRDEKHRAKSQFLIGYLLYIDRDWTTARRELTKVAKTQSNYARRAEQLLNSMSQQPEPMGKRKR